MRMKTYKIERTLVVPTATNIYVSVLVSTDDQDYRLAGTTFIFLQDQPKYDGPLEVEDVKLGRGIDIINRRVTAVTTITKFPVSEDDNDDLPNNCRVVYRIVFEAGDTLLWEEKLSDAEGARFKVEAKVQLVELAL